MLFSTLGHVQPFLHLAVNRAVIFMANYNMRFFLHLFLGITNFLRYKYNPGSVKIVSLSPRPLFIAELVSKAKLTS